MSAAETEQMLLHWNNFHSNLAARFHEFQQREELVDVTIAARGGSVRAHRLLLSACSPYLKELLGASPCDHPVVILKDVGHTELLSILEFMYRGEVRVEQRDLEAFLQAAETLQVKGLTGGRGKTEEEVDSTAAATTTTYQTSRTTDDDSDDGEHVKGRRKRAARKRKRSESSVEQDYAAPACNDACSDTSSSDSNTSVAGDSNASVEGDRTEPLDSPKQDVVFVDVDSDSDVEEVIAADSVKDNSAHTQSHDDAGSLYLTQTSGPADGLQLIQRQPGYPQLVFSNFIFNCQLYEGSSIYWVCQDSYKFNCRATVITVANKVINVYGARHNHDSHKREVEDEMLKGNFRVLPLQRDMFLDVRSGSD